MHARVQSGAISAMGKIKEIKLDKNIPVPLYYQLKKQIITLIENSELFEGDLLPPENVLGEMLDISRNTIRQALGELTAEGYLQRYKSRGSFVCKPKLDAHFFTKLQTFNEEMESKGLNHSTVTLGLEKIPAIGDVNECLDIPLNAGLIHLIRLRFANDMPIVYVETFLPFERYEKLMDVNFNANSLYDSIQKLYGTCVDRMRREIKAVTARKNERDLLKLTRNKAICLVKTWAFSNNIPVEFSVGRYSGDLTKFSVDIFR
jgi:GntR family transcriptional regulator